jgi:hypothetical protein
VEQVEQARRLHQLGCDDAQGFFYSAPVPPEELLDVLPRLGLAGAPRMRIVASHAAGDAAVWSAERSETGTGA